MKFHKLFFLIILFFISVNNNYINGYRFTTENKIRNAVTSSNSNNILLAQSGRSVEKYKFLFMLKWPTVKNDNKHPLNVMDYKNVLLSTSQVVYFVSKNPGNQSPDESWDTTNYIFTMRYEYLDLPCLNRSYVCTHNQFVKEYRPIYPEINFNIPKEVSERFIDPIKASENCIILFLSPSTKVEDAAWLCHEDLQIVYKFQDKLSQIIRENNGKLYDFMADYIVDKNSRQSGIVTLTSDELQFRDMTSRKLILNINFNDIAPYALALYLKEDLKWQGDIGNQPENARCIKLIRKGEFYVNNPDYFCIYYQRNDIAMRVAINIIQARFLAEMYANKINNRLQTISLNKSLHDLGKAKGSVDVDSTMLAPIKNQIRIDYYITRHKLISQIKMGKMEKPEFEEILQKSKEKIISSVCSGLEGCIKAITYCKDKGLLPLKGSREKFAMDMQNPYNTLMPKANIRISLPKGGSVAKKLLSQVMNLVKGNQRNYITDPLPESATGEIPNVTALKKAFNTFVYLRVVSKQYSRVEQLGQNCRMNIRNNTNNLKRKIAMLQFVGDNDTYFEYLGRIRDVQTLRKYR